MIIRITNKCTMGCSHCMLEKKSPDGEHMSLETVDRALRIVRLLYGRTVLISGGEPFEHPNIFEIIAKAKNAGLIVIVTSNGLFALDPEIRQRVVNTNVMVQVTNDPRFYPRNLALVRDLFNHKGWHFEDHVSYIFPCRRTREAGIEANRKAPNCFNVRSVTRAYDIISAVSSLELQGRCCAPSICVDGTIRAGETDSCYKIGTIDSTEGELDEALRNMTCNKCGLVNKLSQQRLAAIGEPPK